VLVDGGSAAVWAGGEIVSVACGGLCGGARDSVDGLGSASGDDDGVCAWTDSTAGAGSTAFACVGAAWLRTGSCGSGIGGVEEESITGGIVRVVAGTIGVAESVSEFTAVECGSGMVELTGSVRKWGVGVTGTLR
jgi:hypothetical protein